MNALISGTTGPILKILSVLDSPIIKEGIGYSKDTLISELHSCEAGAGR
jgi:hypothetical protein